MNYILITLLLISTHACVYAENAEKLKPFTSDGCSSFPDGTFEHNKLWLKCCLQHDKDYWAGGTRQDRINADKTLQQCVTNIGEPSIAQLMLAGVRVGGSPYLPTSFRWGYGWPYPRGYKALTEEEKGMVKNRLNSLNNH